MKACTRTSMVGIRLIMTIPIAVVAIVVAFVVRVCPSQHLRRRIAHPSVRWISKSLLAVLGISLVSRGPRPARGALLVGNHLSWLDVPIALALWQCTFVAKSEVRKWPLLGALGDALGVIWIDRRRARDLLRVIPRVESALRDGATVLLFPEGTTTNGSSILPFRSGLFESATRSGAPVMSVALSARALSTDVDALCWYGNETLVQNIPRVASLRGAQIVAHVGPVVASDVGRKQLARASRVQVQRRFRGVHRIPKPKRQAWSEPIQSFSN